MKINESIERLECEQKMISEASVKFAVFLKTCAILPYNDVFEAYVNHAIEEEQRSVLFTLDTSKVRRLKGLLNVYREEQRMIENAINAQKNELIGANEIDQLVQKLKCEFCNKDCRRSVVFLGRSDSRLTIQS
jgi:hypothetical protein